MYSDKRSLSRRNFLKGVGAAGVGSVLAASGKLFGVEPASTPASQTKPAGADQATAMPRRPFGKTGVNVPILALGGIFDTAGNQLVLRQAIKWGVTYWDTAESYEHGKSEEGMGNFLAANSDARKKLFIVSKTDNRNTKSMADNLQKSLERLKTDYVDMYFIHGIGGTDVLTDEIKAWVEQMKKDGKFKFFGFSTHGNMDACLLGAAKLGWIDGIMMRYNYRAAGEMQAAIEACQKAGVGLTAMKTIAKGQSRGRGRSKGGQEADAGQADGFQRFVDKGFSPEQACLKAVWDNPGIATICSQMPNLTILSANVAAAMDKKELTDEDKKALALHAQATCDGYCAGCTSICQSAVAGAAPIGDVMRCLMYYHGYGEPLRAREAFQQLPAELRRNLARLDYSTAEKLCPQRMAIGELMREAAELLA